MPPSDSQPDQLPPSNHLCQSALSVPRAKTSSRPDAQEQTSADELRTPPSDSHIPQCAPAG